MYAAPWKPSDPIVLASGNPHKLEEMNDLLGGKLTLLSLSAAAAQRGVAVHEPAEPGLTFEANAAIKAMSYAQQLGMPCLADDSGLEIDALGGRPGVISSHYCTDGAEVGMTRAQRDTANNQRVLRELDAVPPAQRAARFVCVLCIAVPPRAEGPEGAEGPERSGVLPQVIASIRGTFDGRIGIAGEVPRGSNGFGYDPLFLVGPDFVRTSAEMSATEKNRLSHRAVAAAKLVEWASKFPAP